MQQVHETFLLPALCREQGDKNVAMLLWYEYQRSLGASGAEGNKLQFRDCHQASYNTTSTGKVDFLFKSPTPVSKSVEWKGNIVFNKSC